MTIIPSNQIMMEGLPNSVALTTILLITLQITILSINPCLAAKSTTKLKPPCPIDFVVVSCLATKYPKLCYNSLSRYATKIHTSQKVLANTALSITLRDIILASSKLHKLVKNPELLDAEVQALRECIEKLKDAEDNTRKCIKEIETRAVSLSFEIRMMNLKKLLKGAIAEVNHCRDVIVGNVVHGVVKTIAAHHILRVIQVTSVTMELLEKYATKQD